MHRRAATIPSRAVARCARVAHNKSAGRPTTPRVGFIGLGNLGEPMAMQVAKAGFDLTVFDIRPDPIARLVALGAKEAGSIDTLAMRCDEYPRRGRRR